MKTQQRSAVRNYWTPSTVLPSAMRHEVIIIGGGLAGLTAAYQLKKQGVSALVLESSDRLGGRIFTKQKGHMQFELGATWIFQDEQLKHLIQELELSIYTQYLSGDALIKYAPTIETQKSSTESLMGGAIYHKVKGGTGAIIEALTKKLDRNSIKINSYVHRIFNEGKKIKVATSAGDLFETNRVIVAVPPRMVAENIQILPDLNNKSILSTTHTWMGNSAKFTVVLDQDYWRKYQLSGFVYSNYGVIREMQDHTSPSGDFFALLGFLQLNEELINDFEKRKHTVVQELKDLFGMKAKNVLGYDDCLWSRHFSDQYGQNTNIGLAPHQNNGHSTFLKAHFKGRLVFAGAETSTSNPGYMEGAVKSAQRAVKVLLNG